MLEPVRSFIQDGGSVVAILLVVSFFLWWAIGARFLCLFHRPKTIAEHKRAASNNPNAQPLDCIFEAVLALHNAKPYEKKSLFYFFVSRKNRYTSIIQSLVIIAPLLGLLGTVSGMIETFRGLGQMTLFTQSGGIAGGIAEALLTTQVGLIVAVPAIIASRLLDRKAQKVEAQLVELWAWEAAL